MHYIEITDNIGAEMNEKGSNKKMVEGYFIILS